MPKKKLSNAESYSPFVHIKYNINGKEIVSEKVLNILDGKSLVEYINTKNNEIYNDIKKILLLFEDNTFDFNTDIYNDFIQLMYDIINIFFTIYSSHVDYTQPQFLDFLIHIKSLNDLYNQLSLGKPQIYCISEDHINNLIIFKQRVEILLKKLSRLDEGLTNI
jgi:hypothetical protein